MTTCCPLEGGDWDVMPAFSSTSTPRAKQEHICCECRDVIPKGAKYQRTSGKWDGSMDTYKTCLSCVEIRDHFACNGFMYGQLWQDLRKNFFPGMRAGGPCMDGLSPEAKTRLFDKRTAWLFARKEQP